MQSSPPYQFNILIVDEVRTDNVMQKRPGSAHSLLPVSWKCSGWWQAARQQFHSQSHRRPMKQRHRNSIWMNIIWQCRGLPSLPAGNPSAIRSSGAWAELAGKLAPSISEGTVTSSGWKTLALSASEGTIASYCFVLFSFFKLHMFGIRFYLFIFLWTKTLPCLVMWQVCSLSRPCRLPQG